jgi:hypothetical protein
MKTKLFLFILITFIGALKSQTYFNKQYYYNNQVANASSAIELDNGGYLFKGCTFGAYNSLLIYKIDAFGDTLFTKEYLKPQSSYSNGASNSFIKSFDNNYIFCESIFENGNRDALLVKLTENGDTLWTKTYGGNNFDNANVVSQTPDSGFVLMGVTQSFSNGPASDFYLIKTDKYGNQQWQQTYGTTLAEDCVSGQITLDGGYVMAGQKNNEFYVVKTNNLGNMQWQRTYPGTSGVCFIKQLADSTYILSGAKWVSGFAGQAYLIKINKAGGVIWQNHYGSQTVNDWFYTQPVILWDGSIVVGGLQMSGSNGWGMLVKTDSAGNEQWLRTYYANPNNDNYVSDVKHTSDGGFLLSGYAQQPWLVKVDSLGCEVAGCSVGVEEFGASAGSATELDLQVYPNPVSQELKVSSQNSKVEAGKIFDVLGKEVLSQEPTTNNQQLTIDVSNLPNGIYFLTSIFEDKTVTKKIIVNH